MGLPTQAVPSRAPLWCRYPFAGRHNVGEQLAMGAALAPLRQQGVLLLGSGVPSFHNFAVFRWDAQQKKAARPLTFDFEAWLQDVLGDKTLNSEQRLARLEMWDSAPGARLCHPQGAAEHFMPTLVLAGAAFQQQGTVARAVFSDTHREILSFQPEFACQHYEFR